MMVCFSFVSDSLFSQVNPTDTFIEPILLDTGWTNVHLPLTSRISNIRASKDLEINLDPNGQLLIKPGLNANKLFHIEIQTNTYPLFIMFAKSLNNVKAKKYSDLIVDTCHLILEKFIERKIYLHTNTIPDELYILWNNTIIPFKRSGKTIIIYLPSHVDAFSQSYIRVYAAKNNQLCKTLMIPLQNGNPVDISESFEGYTWSGTKSINVQPGNISMPLLEYENNIIDSIDTKGIISQENITEQKTITSPIPNWLNVYLDAYYAFYTDSVGVNNYQKFPSISPRSNSFGLNTVQFNFQYSNEKIRGSAMLHFGDYAKTNWPISYNNIMESNVGVRLFKKLWIDAGFFRTHLGTEGLLPRENICSSTAIATYYEPALISGFRFNYLPTDKWIINLYLLNAYNGFEDNNEKKSLGMLISYVLNMNGNIGLSNYIGDDTPSDVDSVSHLRFYQNIFFNYQINKLKIQLGGDFCLQKNSDLINSTKPATMFSGLATASYTLNRILSVYSRLEYFNDPNGIMSTQLVDAKGISTGYKLWGVTAGLEIKPMDKLFIRLEGRQLEMDADQQIFRWKGENKNNRSEIMINMGISF